MLLKPVPALHFQFNEVSIQASKRYMIGMESAYGPDYITLNLVKDNLANLIQSYHQLVNKSLASGKIPDELEVKEGK